MQSKRNSFIEAVASTAIGFATSVVVTAIVLPAYNMPINLWVNFQITAIFTAVSVVRSYYVRRFFNYLHGVHHEV